MSRPLSVRGRASAPPASGLRRWVPPSDAELPPRPSLGGTVAFIVGLVLTWMTLRGDTSAQVASSASWGVALALAASIACDLRLGVRNLIRADLMMICALYFLTLFEFLFEQPKFNEMVMTSSAYRGVELALLAFAGLGIGRHLTSWTTESYLEIFRKPVTPKVILGIFGVCFTLGYLHMLMAVHFDVIEMVSKFLDPRFSQPWGRGKFGDWKALITELGLLLYVIPAIGGVVLARGKAYPASYRWWILGGVAFTFFYGFSSGTRNIFASYLVTFLIGYTFSLPRNETRRLTLMALVTGLALVFSSYLMLNFRTIGLRAYWEGKQEQGPDDQSYFIDYNLYVMCGLAELFPGRYAYLGWEIPYLALIRPIPRALWKEKPEGLSVSIEEAMGAEGLTLAASFVGEAYISGGEPAVFICGLFFGLLAGWWGRLASPRNSDLGNLVYASGFFAAVISMRSLFVFTTAVLPTLAAIVLGQLILARQERRRPVSMVPRPGRPR
jgi:hypothetical protein